MNMQNDINNAIVIFEVLKELQEAQNKHNCWPVDPIHALSILGEEYGELTKAVLEMTYEPHKTSMEELRKEALQTAAMSLRFLYNIDQYKFKKSDQV